MIKAADLRQKRTNLQEKVLKLKSPNPVLPLSGDPHLCPPQSAAISPLDKGNSCVSEPVFYPGFVPTAHGLFLCSSPLRPSPSKQPLFDPEPRKENLTEPQSSERNVPSSLSHLIGQFAETAEDRYRILEQRDKVLRQGEGICQHI